MTWLPRGRLQETHSIKQQNITHKICYVCSHGWRSSGFEKRFLKLKSSLKAFFVHVRSSSFLTRGCSVGQQGILGYSRSGWCQCAEEALSSGRAVSVMDASGCNLGNQTKRLIPGETIARHCPTQLQVHKRKTVKSLFFSTVDILPPTTRLLSLNMDESKLYAVPYHTFIAACFHILTECAITASKLVKQKV